MIAQAEWLYVQAICAYNSQVQTRSFRLNSQNRWWEVLKKDQCAR